MKYVLKTFPRTEKEVLEAIRAYKDRSGPEHEFFCLEMRFANERTVYLVREEQGFVYRADMAPPVASIRATLANLLDNRRLHIRAHGRSKYKEMVEQAREFRRGFAPPERIDPVTATRIFEFPLKDLFDPQGFDNGNLLAGYPNHRLLLVALIRDLVTNAFKVPSAETVFVPSYGLPNPIFIDLHKQKEGSIWFDEEKMSCILQVNSADIDELSKQVVNALEHEAAVQDEHRY